MIPKFVFLEVIIGLLRSKAFVRAIRQREFDDVSEIVDHVEWIVEQGFNRYPNLITKVDRPSLLSKLLFEGIAGLSAAQLEKRIINIRTGLVDILKYHNRLERRLAVDVGDYEIYKLPGLDQNFWQNISTGLSGTYIRLKYMFANNHLLGKVMDDPSPFLSGMVDQLKRLGTVLPNKKTIGVGLENGSRYIEKIDDATIAMEVPNLAVRVGSRILDLGPVWLRSSFDSKFYLNPNNLGQPKTVAQQIMLTFQDRVKDDFIPVVRKVIASDLSPEEQGQVLKDLIPLFFQHHVVKPSDTKEVSQKVLDAYADAFTAEGIPHFESVLATEIPGFDIHHEEALLAILDGVKDHAKKHFRSGKFISTESDMLYFDRRIGKKGSTTTP